MFDYVQRYAIPISSYLSTSTCRDFERVVLFYLWLLDFGRLLDVSSRELLSYFLSPYADCYMSVVERR
jgi:hypothetical protein